MGFDPEVYEELGNYHNHWTIIELLYIKMKIFLFFYFTYLGK